MPLQKNKFQTGVATGTGTGTGAGAGVGVGIPEQAIRVFVTVNSLPMWLNDSAQTSKVFP